MKISPTAVSGALIAALAAALYLPFLGNALVFDDGFFFSGRNFARYATTPFGLELRRPAYFSLASVEVIWGGIRSHRLVSLALHIATALVLYKLVVDLLRQAASQVRVHLAAFGAAAAFALHPIAVYGAGYLIQRTGLLATLFALVSLLLFARGATRGSHADAVSGAACYALAVLSKETAVLVPAAALVVLSLVRCERRFALRHAAIYAGLCLPAAVLVTLLVKGKIGATYEPDFAVVASQAVAMGTAPAGSPWLTSAMTQAELFFRYLGLWLWPDTDAMSIDLRVELGGGAGWAAAFFLFPALCGALLVRGGRWALAGFGLAWFWILFLVELTTVRFADAFVLYRSYLWAPGLAIAFAALASSLPGRLLVVLLVAGVPALAIQAHDRLQSFSTGLAVWQDAVDKLPAGAPPGGSRTLYQLGREQLYSGDADKAIATIDRCIARYPQTYDCWFARAAIHVELEEYERALPFIRRAAELRPDSGAPVHLLGVALENSGRIEEARASYHAAVKLGFKGARYRLQQLDEPGKGLLPATRSAKPPPD
ncbi:MAG TPA: tetratricopeptide repeat protein [Burkholderiales bacterium]|nr:tetratricopeptide repeat protein [Burkholderiales bacterium]